MAITYPTIRQNVSRLVGDLLTGTTSGASNDCLDKNKEK